MRGLVGAALRGAVGLVGGAARVQLGGVACGAADLYQGAAMRGDVRDAPNKYILYSPTFFLIGLAIGCDWL
jgi:hypothetical protein